MAAGGDHAPNPGNKRGTTCWLSVAVTASRLNGATSSAARAAYPGAGSSSAARSAGARSSPTSRGIELAGQPQRRVGARRRRGDEHGPVGQRLELGDPEVLAPRGGDEDPRAPQQRAELVGGHAAGEAHARDVGGALDPGDHQRLLAPAGTPPGLQQEVEPPLHRIGGVGHDVDVALTAAGRPELCTATGTTTLSGRAPAASGASESRRHRQHQRRPGQPPSLDDPLPHPVAPGAVLGRDRVQPDRPGLRPQQRGGDRAVDDQPRVDTGRSPRAAARRAASAWTRSVSMNVRTSRTGPVSTVTVRAPARSNAAPSSRAAARQPVVAPTETIRTSVAPSGPGTAMATSDLAGRPRRGGAVELHQVGAKARGAHQLDGLQRRRALDVEARAVALLDRRHRA